MSSVEKLASILKALGPEKLGAALKRIEAGLMPLDAVDNLSLFVGADGQSY